jgi:hypothetical protein
MKMTMFSKLFLTGAFSTVLAANLGLASLASASTAPVRASAGSRAAARVYAGDDKKKDDKKGKSDDKGEGKAEGKAEGKKGGDKKPAPGGGW